MDPTPPSSCARGCVAACGYSPAVLDRAGVASLLGISSRHLDDVRRLDFTFPPPRFVGSLARWHRDVVLDWVREPSLAAAKSAGTDLDLDAGMTPASPSHLRALEPLTLSRDVSELLTPTAPDAGQAEEVDLKPGRPTPRTPLPEGFPTAPETPTRKGRARV